MNTATTATALPTQVYERYQDNLPRHILGLSTYLQTRMMHILQEDYGRLLLEQSTWASHHRVEKVARKDLGMRAPDLARYTVVAP